MQFAEPKFLMLLLVFPPALLVFFWWSFAKRRELMAQFIQARLLPGLVSGMSLMRQKVRLACLVAAVACLLIALARPQWGATWEEVKVRGVDIVVAIDTSKSMLAQDVAPTRLARAKLAALDLMQLAKADRLGLVAFAGSAFLQCPLTIDDAAFRQSVEALDVNIIPQGGTAIAEAIEVAQTAFKEGDNHRVLVLMTDGEDHDSGALEAAQKAAAAGMRIYTIGIGTAEGELLRIKDAQGQSDYIRDEQGNVVKSHLNERLLQEIAGATEGGFYLPLRGAKTMDTLYEQGLASLPKSEHQAKLVKRFEERYQWPLGLGILLLVLEVLIPERKREPKGTGGLALPKRSLQAALWSLLLILMPNAGASPSSALREYKAGQYDEAQKEYERLLRRNADDPRLHFNAGAAAYRNRQFDEAAKQFNEAVASPDLKLQQLSYYNRGNANYWLGEKNPDPSKRTEAWEKSLKDYELAMKLNPQDPDAKFNHEFVKKRLEQLKQQQQQNKNQDNKNDQKDQRDQQNPQQQNQKNQQNDQSKQDEKQPQQEQQNQDQQKQDSSKQDQQNQQKQDQQQQQAAQQAQEQQNNQPQQSTGQSKEQSGETNEQAYGEIQMTPEQARQLLDAQKGDEKMLSPKPEGKPQDHSKPVKDW